MTNVRVCIGESSLDSHHLAKIQVSCWRKPLDSCPLFWKNNSVSYIWGRENPVSVYWRNSGHPYCTELFAFAQKHKHQFIKYSNCNSHMCEGFSSVNQIDLIYSVQWNYAVTVYSTITIFPDPICFIMIVWNCLIS
jgi:hypothetical protein